MLPRERTLPGWHGSPARRTHVADARVIDVTDVSQPDFEAANPAMRLTLSAPRGQNCAENHAKT
jgi:hypothetical protein